MRHPITARTAAVLDRPRDLQVHRVEHWVEPGLGLEALLVLDDVTLGPAAGGVRTRRYHSVEHAFADAVALARAMTLKCALAGLAAGGGKCVVLDSSGLDRPRAFAYLGERIEALGGEFRTAGDLGTTAADLAAMASRCRYVHTDERGLAASVGRGLLRCVEACAAQRGVAVAGLHVAVQGAGAIGAAVAAALTAAGVRVTIADLDDARARAVAAATGADVTTAGQLLTLRCDVLAPCAIGGVIDLRVARALRAWAVCGAANNLLGSSDAEDVLVGRGILHVPDVVSSAGAVIDGVGETVMGLVDRTPMIDGLGATAARILAEAAATGERATEVAARLARVRLATAHAGP